MEQNIIYADWLPLIRDTECARMTNTKQKQRYIAFYALSRVFMYNWLFFFLSFFFCIGHMEMYYPSSHWRCSDQWFPLIFGFIKICCSQANCRGWGGRRWVFIYSYNIYANIADRLQFNRISRSFPTISIVICIVAI